MTKLVVWCRYEVSIQVAGRMVELSADGDIHTQLAGIRAVRALSYNKRERLQECLLQSPGAISHLMDLLERQEVVRNEILLILLQISQSNPQVIQFGNPWFSYYYSNSLIQRFLN